MALVPTTVIGNAGRTVQTRGGLRIINVDITVQAADYLFGFDLNAIRQKLGLSQIWAAHGTIRASGGAQRGMLPLWDRQNKLIRFFFDGDPAADAGLPEILSGDLTNNDILNCTIIGV